MQQGWGPDPSCRCGRSPDTALEKLWACKSTIARVCKPAAEAITAQRQVACMANGEDGCGGWRRTDAEAGAVGEGESEGGKGMASACLRLALRADRDFWWLAVCTVPDGLPRCPGVPAAGTTTAAAAAAARPLSWSWSCSARQHDV